MSENTNPNVNPQSTPANSAHPLPPKKRRRRWPLIVGGLLGGLVVLVALAPTIASMGFVRSMVLPSVSKAVAPNGKLEVDSWSFGWLSGQKLTGIRLLDDQNAVVAHLSVDTGASLLSLIRGNYDLGVTNVTGDFDVRIDPESARVNLLHVMNIDPFAPSTEPLVLPALKGKVKVNLNGTLSSTNADSKKIPFTKVETAKVDLDITDLNAGVAIDALIKADVGGKPTNITLKGTADAIDNLKMQTDPNKIAADLDAKIDRLDLTVANVVLAAMGMSDQSLAGLMQGSFAIKLTPGGAATIQSGDNLGIDNLIYSGPALKGDTLALKRTDLKVNISRQGQSGVFEIADTGLKSDLASVQITGTLPQSAIQNLMEHKAPGAKGSIKIESTVPDFAKLAAMLPRTIALKEGTTVTGGGLTSTTTIDIAETQVDVAEIAKLDASGTANGKSIRFEPTTFNAGTSLVAREGKFVASDLQAIKKLSIDLAAPFANVKGDGVPEKIRFDGNIDLTKLRDSVTQFIDLGGIDFSGIVTFALNTEGVPTDASKPLGAKLTFNTDRLTFANAGETYLSNEKIQGTVDLIMKQTPESKVFTFNQLKIGTESGLFGVWTSGDSLWVAVFNNGSIGGVGEVHVRAKLDRLAAMFAKNVDPSMKLNRGVLDSVLTLTSDTAKNEYKVVMQSDLTKLDVGDMLANETLNLGLTMFVPGDFTASHTWYEVASNFVAVKGEADLKLTDPKGKEISPFDRVQKLDFEGSIPSFAKLNSLAASLMGTSKTTAEGEPLPPLKVTAGSAAFSGTVARDSSKNTTSLTLNVPAIENLTMERGSNRFTLSKPATIKLAASVTNDPAKPAGVAQLEEIIVSQLDAQLPGIANVAMAKPIQITNLGADQPDAQGELSGNATLAPFGDLLAVINGANPIPYSGNATFTQSITSANGKADVVGKADVTNLAPIGKDAAALPLHSVVLTNQLSADMKNQNLDIRTVKIAAPQLGDSPLLDIKGSLLNWGSTQELKDVQAAFDLKWESVWTLLKPMVDPNGTLAVTMNGDYKNVWKANGKLSDLSTLNASGELAFKTLNAAGLNLTQKGPLSIPLTVKDGKTRFATSDGKDMDAVTVNDGTMKLAGIELTLKGMTLDAPKKHQLMRNVQINSVLANQLGKYASVLFAKSSKATGTLDVKIEKMQDLPITDLAHMNETQNAKIAFSVRDLYLDGYVPKALEAIADLGTSGLRAEIKDAALYFDQGKVRNDVTFTILRMESTRDKDGKPREVRIDLPMAALGSIDLATLKLVDSRINLPTGLIKSDEIRKFLGDSVAIPVTGFANAPQLNPGKILEEIVKQNLRDPSKILGGLLGGNGSSNKATDDKKSDVDKVGDILGGLLGGKKSEDKPVDKPKDEPPATDDAPKKKKKKD